MNSKLIPMLAPVLAAGLSLPAVAQTVGGRNHQHFELTGNLGFQKLGYSSVGMNDLDGDLVPDYVIGSPGISADRGNVTAYSGATGLQLWTVDGEYISNDFGHAMTNLRDINDDGVDDLAVSAPSYDILANNAGKVYLMSGVDGSVIRTWNSHIAGREFGEVLGSADINNDGYLDLIIGMPTADELGWFNNGKIAIFNARTGALFGDSEVVGGQDFGYFGCSVTGVGDWDGDGYRDVASGAYAVHANGLVESGRVTILSGATLAGISGAGPLIIQSINGSQAGANFGHAIARVGDHDGDGEVDLAIGEPRWDDGSGTVDAGRVTLWSSSSHTMLASYESPDPVAYARFGNEVARAGDVDNDGFKDILIGAPYYTEDSFNITGAAFAFSGRTDALLQGNRGTQHNGLFGFSMAGIGDIDGDGTHEYVVGAPEESSSIFTANGSATVFGREAFLFQNKKSANGGDTIDYEIDFPTAGGQYKILASLVGVGPTNYTGTDVPLGPLYIPITSNSYPAFTSGFYGTLNGNGDASASMTLPVGTPPLTIYLAAIQSATGATVDLSSVVQILEVH